MSDPIKDDMATDELARRLRERIKQIGPGSQSGQWIAEALENWRRDAAEWLQRHPAPRMKRTPDEDKWPRAWVNCAEDGQPPGLEVIGADAEVRLYLVVLNGHFVTVGAWYKRARKWRVGQLFMTDDVTHWAELPPSPRLLE